MIAAARDRGVPLRTVEVNEPHLRDLYEKRFVLVLLDQHVAWRGDTISADSASIIETVRGVIYHE